MSKLYYKWTTCVVFCLSLVSANAKAEQVTVNLTNGTVVVVETDFDQIVPWKTINASGESKEQPCKLGDLKRINLTDKPASMQISQVRGLLNQLDSDDYAERNRATARLSEPDLGIPFRELIESESENESLEVRARVEKILMELKSTKETKQPEFDILHLNDGTVLKGDVGELVFKCTYRGQEIVLKRDSIRRLSAGTVPAPAAKVDGTLAVESIHKHQAKFFQDPQRMIDFESALTSDDQTNKDLTTEYLDRGVIMTADGKGYVGLSGYPFKYPETPTGGQSACVVDASGLYRKRFEGAMQFSFCMPGLPDIPAGVNEFGLFLSRVDHPRDFILEAYNAESQLLGTTEATDELCVFLGIRSNQPIAFVRILSNPYLFEVDRKIDSNYAIDNIWFGKPKALTHALVARNPGGVSTISLKSGEMIGADDIRFNGETTRAFDAILGKQFKIPNDEISSIRFPVGEAQTLFRRPIPTSNEWLVMLKDHSILKVTPGEAFTSALLEGKSFKPEEIMAIWSERDPMRYPEKGDFENAKNVLVFPTCRWQTNVQFADSRVSWRKGEQVLQPVYPRLEQEETKTGKVRNDRREDVTPKFTSFDFNKRTESQMPTIWLAQPKLTPATQGAVYLNDGQKISFGDESGFSLSSLGKREVELTGSDQQSFKIPVTDIREIRFPSKQ